MEKEREKKLPKITPRHLACSKGLTGVTFIESRVNKI
jgi:hypothetical protein